MRIAAVVLALVAAGWYVIGIRQAHELDAASAIIRGSAPLTPARARRAAELLHAAKLLNPDREVDMLRAQLDRARGDVTRARAILDRVVASEPDNAEAWFQLAGSSAGSPSTFARALRNFWRLEPPVKPAR